jgi:hypothetical protein
VEHNRGPGQLISSLIVLAATWWVMQPPHRQQELRMRLALKVQQRTQSLAHAFGEDAMQRELEGDADGAHVCYRTAYRLMTGLHERAGRWYAGAGQ